MVSCVGLGLLRWSWWLSLWYQDWPRRSRRGYGILSCYRLRNLLLRMRIASWILHPDPVLPMGTLPTNDAIKWFGHHYLLTRYTMSHQSYIAYHKAGAMSNPKCFVCKNLHKVNNSPPLSAARDTIVNKSNKGKRRIPKKFRATPSYILIDTFIFSPPPFG